MTKEEIRNYVENNILNAQIYDHLFKSYSLTFGEIGAEIDDTVIMDSKASFADMVADILCVNNEDNEENMSDDEMKEHLCKEAVSFFCTRIEDIVDSSECNFTGYKREE
ncbi:MAG: hypothetical protein CMB80_00395 [Flammeovirgaceae bacterium]|jgi:hypothetical protein|nr:hypothetical protein [Flammeovirgaceae bacterium]|tara:strand:- start:5761 stop:6087 length:327 start_codon:yes stop_codon:yes gene_type:complete